LRITSSPTEAGPPKAPAQPVSTDQPELWLRSTRPNAAVASSTTGTPACCPAVIASAYGCRVPDLVVRHLDRGQSGAVDGESVHPLVQVHPPVVIDADRVVLPGRGRRAQHRGMIDRGGDDP
jgi:hypothetical protein